MSARSAHRLATAGVAFGSPTLLGLLVLPVGALVLRSGADGIRQLGSDPELRASLALTGSPGRGSRAR